MPVPPRLLLIRKRIFDVESSELPEIAVGRIQPADPVLKENGSQLRIGHEISADHDSLGDVLVGSGDTVQFRHRPHMRWGEQRFDVLECFLRQQWPSEDARVCGNAKVGHHGGPG